MEYDGRNLFLRYAESKDMDLLFSWANDPVVRNNSFHTAQISYEEHQKWFAALMRDERQVQYIFMADEEPAGQIRFSISGERAEIDYSISPEKRGKGLGKIMLDLAKKELQQFYPEISTLIGQVKYGNTASEKCFLDSGYQESFKQFELKIGERQNGTICDCNDKVMEHKKQ